MKEWTDGNSRELLEWWLSVEFMFDRLNRRAAIQSNFSSFHLWRSMAIQERNARRVLLLFHGYELMDWCRMPTLYAASHALVSSCENYVLLLLQAGSCRVLEYYYCGSQPLPIFLRG